jgi:hypothetical protein
MNSSSSDEASTEVKQEEFEGQRNPNYDPNDEDDLRNGLLADDHQDDHLFSSSLSKLLQKSVQLSPVKM